MLASPNPSPETYRQAEGHLLRAIQGNPDLPGAEALLGDLYLKQGQRKRAVDHLTRAAKQEPELALVLAHLHEAEGNAKKATVWASTACDQARPRAEANPDDHRARIHWAWATLILKDYSMAVAILERGWAVTRADVYPPALSQAYAIWVRELARDRTVPLAQQLSVVEKGLRQAPGNAALLARLLEISHLTGPEGNKARSSLRAMLAQGSPPACLHLCLGIDAWQRGEHGQAQQHLKRAFDLAPHFPIVANNMAWVLAEAPTPICRGRSLLSMRCWSAGRRARIIGTRAGGFFSGRASGRKRYPTWSSPCPNCRPGRPVTATWPKRTANWV